jgi:hypothetical protein
MAMLRQERVVQPMARIGLTMVKRAAMTFWMTWALMSRKICGKYVEEAGFLEILGERLGRK